MSYRDADLGEGVVIYEKSEGGKVLKGTCRGTPPSTANEFAVGAEMFDIDNKIVYRNTGTEASPVWEKYAGGNATHAIIAAGVFTTAGGDADESITVSGAVAGDIAIVSLKTKGSTPRTILTAAAGTNKIDLVFSGDPSTDHVVSYMLLRAE